MVVLERLELGSLSLAALFEVGNPALVDFAAASGVGRQIRQLFAERLVGRRPLTFFEIQLLVQGRFALLEGLGKLAALLIEVFDALGLGSEFRREIRILLF